LLFTFEIGLYKAILNISKGDTDFLEISIWDYLSLSQLYFLADKNIFRKLCFWGSHYFLYKYRILCAQIPNIFISNKNIFWLSKRVWFWT